MSRTWEKQLRSIVKKQSHKLRAKKTPNDGFWERWKAEFANSETAIMNGG
jgi:hypothetical protein